MKNSALKFLMLYMTKHPYTARPRVWVRLFVNPWIIKRGLGTKIRSTARLDIFPHHHFELGSRTIIESRATINNGVGDIIVGDNCRIGIGCTIIGPITIGNDVHFAQNIVAMGFNYKYQHPRLVIHQQGHIAEPIIIENDVWIGPNAFLAAGITIGGHSVVAAGAVVTHSVPELSVVAGNPARIIKQFDADSGRWIAPFK